MNKSLTQYLSQKIHEDKEFEHYFSVWVLTMFIAMIVCFIFLTPIYQRWLTSLASFVLLSEDGRLSLMRNYEFCQVTGSDEYKENLMNKFTKDVDMSNYEERMQAYEFVEVYYKLHRFDCEEDFHYREIMPTQMDIFIIKNLMFIDPIAFFLSIMTPRFLLWIYVKYKRYKTLSLLRKKNRFISAKKLKNPKMGFFNNYAFSSRASAGISTGSAGGT